MCSTASPHNLKRVHLSKFECMYWRQGVYWITARKRMAMMVDGW